jgi:hypothetical protein
MGDGILLAGTQQRFLSNHARTGGLNPANHELGFATAHTAELSRCEGSRASG